MSSVATIGLGWEIITRKTFTTLIFCLAQSKSERIFRSYHINSETEFGLWDFVGEAFIKMNQFQKDYLNFNASIFDSKSEVGAPTSNHKLPQRWRFLHWHIHPRFPNNYGLIQIYQKKEEIFIAAKQNLWIIG